MYIEQLYTNCLAEAAYYIESGRRSRHYRPYSRNGSLHRPSPQEEVLTIKYIFETHFHADFISGHIDLSKKTGAAIIYGPMAETKYISAQRA